MERSKLFDSLANILKSAVFCFLVITFCIQNAEARKSNSVSGSTVSSSVGRLNIVGCAQNTACYAPDPFPGDLTFVSSMLTVTPEISDPNYQSWTSFNIQLCPAGGYYSNGYVYTDSSKSKMMPCRYVDHNYTDANIPIREWLTIYYAADGTPYTAAPGGDQPMRDANGNPVLVTNWTFYFEGIVSQGGTHTMKALITQNVSLVPNP